MAVRVTPKSSQNRILGAAPDAEGGMVLRIGVTAPPEDGKANEALVDFLTKGLRLPRRDLAIVQGAANRRKLLRLSGDPDMLYTRINSFIGQGTT